MKWTNDPTVEQQSASTLTVIPQKLQLYQQDVSFREALHRLSYAIDRSPIDFLRHLTGIIIKPDGIACRKGTAILEFMLGQGLIPISTQRLRLQHQTMHSIWRYQWNRAAIDRVRLSTLMGTSGDSLLVILSDPSQSSAIPLPVRLWALKGSAFAVERQPHHLRSHLGINGRFFGYVHLPDEPADLIRELALLFPGDKLTQFLFGLKSEHDVTSETLRELRQLESETERFEVAEELSLARVHERIRKAEVNSRLAEQLCANKDGVPVAITLAGIEDACFFKVHSGLDWDLVVVAAMRVPDNLPGVAPLIDSGEAETAIIRWTARGTFLL